jgi:solute carrier family 25 ornithine transporter 2/15
MITREIIKNEGFKGMFRGLVPTFAREMPGKHFCVS